MNLLEQISKLRMRTTGNTGGGRIAVAHWDRENISFLVVTPKSKHITENDIGMISHVDVGNPLLALSQHFQNNSINVQRLVVLLSRPELDLPTLNLPPADASELPSLIASEVEQQLGETEDPPIVDFHVIPNPDSDGTAPIQVLAFALPAKELSNLQKQVEPTNFRLAAICSRHLAPLSILRRQNIPDTTLAVAVHLYAGEVELAVCRGAEPILLRTIRLSTDEPSRVAEQIWMEMQRCLTLLTQETAELKLCWYVFATNDAAKQVATALQEHGVASIHTIDPLVDWDFDRTSATKDLDSITTSAANAGAAWDFVNNALTVNLLAPKRPPKPQNPMVRWAAIGAGAALVLSVAVYFLLSDVWQLQIDVDAIQSELNDTQKLTAKYQEKSDQVAAVQSWLSDQVDWLAELNELSNRLPDGQDATVRRLTGSSNANTATIDLSVQVAQQEFISQLESRIRSAKYAATSKQISQNPDSSEYPWQFETRISFPIENQKANAYQPKAVAKPVDPPSKDTPQTDTPSPSDIPAAPATDAPIEDTPTAEPADEKPVDPQPEPKNAPAGVPVEVAK